MYFRFIEHSPESQMGRTYYDHGKIETIQPVSTNVLTINLRIKSWNTLKSVDKI